MARGFYNYARIYQCCQRSDEGKCLCDVNVEKSHGGCYEFEGTFCCEAMGVRVWWI